MANGNCSDLIKRFLEQGNNFNYESMPKHEAYGRMFLSDPPVDWVTWCSRIKALGEKNLQIGSIPLKLISEGHSAAMGLEGRVQEDFDRSKSKLMEGLRLLQEALENDEHGELLEAVSTMQMPVTLSKIVFIGHGGSRIWKDLQEFLINRLSVKCEEFNSEPQPGRSNKERLVELLSVSGFAFLVMTAEDEHADSTVHARENVVHEIGLFQGKLGFERAIILLEEGCAEFSNINGIVQIRFPQGNIEAVSEQIRRVLEREGILAK